MLLRGGVLPHISYIGRFRQSGYHFQGPLSWTGYTISHFRVLNRVIPANLPPSITYFHWFRAPSLNCAKTQTYVPFLVFWIWPAWSSLEQGKKLQHFLLDRVPKFTSFVSWTGSGFRWVSQTPLPKFLLSTPPGGVTCLDNVVLKHQCKS